MQKVLRHTVQVVLGVTIGERIEAMANPRRDQHEDLAQPRAVAGGGGVRLALQVGHHNTALLPGAQQLGGSQQPLA